MICVVSIWSNLVQASLIYQLNIGYSIIWLAFLLYCLLDSLLSWVGWCICYHWQLSILYLKIFEALNDMHNDWHDRIELCYLHFIVISKQWSVWMILSQWWLWFVSLFSLRQHIMCLPILRQLCADTHPRMPPSTQNAKITILPLLHQPPYFSLPPTVGCECFLVIHTSLIGRHPPYHDGWSIHHCAGYQPRRVHHSWSALFTGNWRQKLVFCSRPPFVCHHHSPLPGPSLQPS